MVVRCAPKLASLLFLRPGELRKAQWAEFNREFLRFSGRPELLLQECFHAQTLCA
jgi:hypothetical protein